MVSLDEPCWMRLAALDKLMGESLEPTYAEMWLAKRGNVEPYDWLESYRTWKDQMEL